MSRTTTLAAVIAAAALIGAAPASAKSGKPAKHRASGPVAHASGDPVTILPAIVRTRTRRVDNAIDRLTDFVDDKDMAGVARTGKVIRRQLAAAWRGAVYFVKNPPPPVADDAQESDDLPTIADPVTAAMAVFDSYDSVAATISQLVDGAREPFLASMSRTLFWTLDKRDASIAKAHELEGPVDPEGEEGEEGAATFAVSIPFQLTAIDDEVRQVNGLLTDATDLRPGGRRILTLAAAQLQRTEATINTIWPPEIED